jgi:hypothetical protein
MGATVVIVDTATEAGSITGVAMHPSTVLSLPYHRTMLTTTRWGMTMMKKDA